MEEGTKDTDDAMLCVSQVKLGGYRLYSLSTNMRRCNLGNVLRTRAKRSAKAQDETSSHQTSNIGRSSLDGGGGDGEEAAGKVDTASTDLISQAEERCTAEVANSHKGVDDAERGALVLEAIVVVPVLVGVDTADYTPIDTVAVSRSVAVIQKHVLLGQASKPLTQPG